MVKQSIASAIKSAVTAVVDAIQTKHKEEMLALRKMIKKSLLLRESSSTIPLLNLIAIPKAHPSADFLSKITTKRWNQANWGYFDPHLDRVHGKGVIVLVGKDMYYRNIIFFLQCFQSLVTFRDTALIKANIATSLRGSALEWYTSEHSDFDCNALNNDLGVKSWINIFSHHFKVPMSMALDLLTNETYSLNDTQAQQFPA